MGPASESFVSSHLMIDSVWEDMNDDGHRFFCWLPDPLLTQCGKTGVATAKSKLFVPHCGKKCYRSCQDLITAKMWHSCSRLNCIVSAHVALIAQLHIRVLSFCGQVLFRSVAVDANNCRLRCGSLPKNYIFYFVVSS